MHTTRSGVTFINYDQYRNIEKQNNLNVFGINKPKDTNRDSQNQLRPPMPEGGSFTIVKASFANS